MSKGTRRSGGEMWERGVDAVGKEPGVTPASRPLVALLTGCQDRPYALGLATALVSAGVRVDFVGSDELDSPELHETPGLTFVNLRARQSRLSPVAKVQNLLGYYARLVRYAAMVRPDIVHVLWNNKFEYIDRTLLMLYYRALGTRIVLTAHNVNQARRDSKDSALNRLTLRAQYQLADHIFVHTEKMKSELRDDFGVSVSAITVLRHPINTAFPDSALTPGDAKRRLGIAEAERSLLFFGRIAPYKGLAYLLDAFQRLTAGGVQYRLIIAGQPKKGHEEYLHQVVDSIRSNSLGGQVIFHDHFIPDDQIEVYFKAADVLVLPYTDIFQSGVLFLSYTFGLPVIAADVGSFREDIIEDSTGFVCRPRDPADLAEVSRRYFDSDLFRNLDRRREDIREHARKHHSWANVASATRQAYVNLSQTASWHL